MRHSIRARLIAGASAARAQVTLENDQFITPAKPVEQLPTELPYAKIEDDSDETGVTVEPVTIDEIHEELETALADIALDITSLEQLGLVATLSSQHLSNNALEEYVRSAVGLESGTRLLAATTTGGIQCTADIISLEEIAGNAAKAGWENLGRKISTLLTKVEEVSSTTAETGTRIQEQFRALKKPAFDYRGGATINISAMSGGDNNLNAVIANTKAAIQEDLSGRISGALDRQVNDLAKSATTIITSKKGDLNSIIANGVKGADSLSSQYKIRDPEFKILGFTRKTLDDQLTLPQGIIGALSGNGRTYNFPRYTANKAGKRIEIELKPNTVKDLYAIGMNIGNEISDQARLWPQRLEVLKSLVELCRHQAGNVDADRNTWSAEQTGARNALKMWNANASARKHYINIYNKIASEILQVLNHVTNSTPSTEAFGGFFSKKPQETPKSPVPASTDDVRDFIKSTAFTGFKDNYTADIPAYSDNLKDHVAGMHKASSEIGRSFNESNINKYVDDVGRLLDRCYAQFQMENPDEDDWRAIGNGVLEIFTPEFTKSKLMSKHFGMHYNNGIYITQFDYAPNMEISKVTETRHIDNKRVIKRLVNGFTKDTALQFFSLFDKTSEIWSAHQGFDRSTFIREHPRYEDSVYIIAIEPLIDVTQRLFEIMDETFFAIKDGIITA